MYLYSQTGQLREVADALTAPLIARGWSIRWVDVQPRVAFPFPWPIRRFFGVFPAAVDPESLVELVEPAGGFGTQPDELVILAYQVWYLAPSLPVRSLLNAHPEAVRDRRVVSLIACRNMWYSAAIEVSGLLRSAGARGVEVVAATDTRRPVNDTGDHAALAADRQARTLSVVRAGRGRRRGTRSGRRCGSMHRRVRADFARRGAHRAHPGCGGSPCRHGVSSGGAPTVRSARRLGAMAQAASLATFVLGLGIGILVGMPLIGCAALAGGARFDTLVADFVHRRITFGPAALYQAEVA